MPLLVLALLSQQMGRGNLGAAIGPVCYCLCCFQGSGLVEGSRPQQAKVLEGIAGIFEILKYEFNGFYRIFMEMVTEKLKIAYLKSQ